MKKFLMWFDLLNGLVAVAGGLGLVLNIITMPLDLLKNSPFHSYFWPGMILLIIVGGSLLAASLLAWIDSKRAWLGSLLAGIVLLIWILTQMAMIGIINWLQFFMLAVSLTIIVISIKVRYHLPALI